MLLEILIKLSKSLSKSGTDKFKALFILEASIIQLLVPTKLILFSFRSFALPSISILLRKAFKGLYLDL